MSFDGPECPECRDLGIEKEDLEDEIELLKKDIEDLREAISEAVKVLEYV